MAGRYAPSPTSALHLGNLRTALVAWLMARSTGRRFVLRIEDLDQARVAAAAGVAAGQVADLAALGIDFDPEAIANWRRMGLEAAFGDATDPEFLAHLHLAEVRAVVSAVPRERNALTEADPQLALLHGLKANGYNGRIFLSVQDAADADDLVRRGASVILKPFDDAADYAVRQLTGT